MLVKWPNLEKGTEHGFLQSITTKNINFSDLTLLHLNLLFGKQDWLKGEFQIKVLNLIPKQTENRLGT